MSCDKEAMQYTMLHFTRVISCQEQLTLVPKRDFVPLLCTPTLYHNAQVSTKAIGPNLRREYGSTLKNARKESYLELYIW